MRKLTALVTSLCLTLLLLCPAVVTCHAAELNAFLTAHEIVTGDTGSQLLVYGSKLPENGTLTVSVDSQTIPNPVLSTVRQEKLPVTVYCLVDLSSHMSNQQIQEQKDILNIISSRMGDEDTMVISTVGSKLIEGALLDTLEARKTAISTLSRDSAQADMYSAVVTAMTTLEQKTSYHANRCLLILSDGLQDTQDGSQQAMSAITATTIPVYALGITGGSDGSYSVKNAERMLKLAEVSRNGLGLIPAQEDMSAAAAAQDIWEHIQESSVIKIDLAVVASGSNNAVVRAQYQLGDTRLEDTVTVDLTQASPAISGGDTAEATDATNATGEVLAELDDPSINSDSKLLWILAIGAGVLIAAIVVICVLKAGKKRKAQEAAGNADTITATAPVVEDLLFMDEPEKTASADSGKWVENYAKTAPATGAVAIRMTMVGHESVSVSFRLPPHDQQILGRDDRANIILNAEDYQLSGKHCLLEWDGSYLYIQDMGSTNGTILNGMSLKPNSWNRLNNGSTLHMGSFEYQVTIHL